MRRYLRGVTTGTLIGMAAGMYILPQLDRGTKKRIRKTAKQVMNTANDAYETMADWIK